MQRVSDPRLPIPHLNLAEGGMEAERFVGVDLGVRAMEGQVAQHASPHGERRVGSPGEHYATYHRASLELYGNQQGPGTARILWLP